MQFCDTHFKLFGYFIFFKQWVYVFTINGEEFYSTLINRNRSRPFVSFHLADLANIWGTTWPLPSWWLSSILFLLHALHFGSVNPPGFLFQLHSIVTVNDYYLTIIILNLLLLFASFTISSFYIVMAFVTVPKKLWVNNVFLHVAIQWSSSSRYDSEWDWMTSELASWR